MRMRAREPTGEGADPSQAMRGVKGSSAMQGRRKETSLIRATGVGGGSNDRIT